jgi:hypothetical protein
MSVDTRPTREQIEAARVWLAENWSIAPDPRDITEEGVERTVQMITILLAVTAQPTDEELAEEAERAWSSVRLRLATLREFRAIYIAGARREGRR